MVGVKVCLMSCICLCLCRDGGLKRAKVKDTFKEQEQKKYSSMVVGDDSSNSD